jgi:hypothetical protein
MDARFPNYPFQRITECHRLTFDRRLEDATGRKVYLTSTLEL